MSELHPLVAWAVDHRASLTAGASQTERQRRVSADTAETLAETGFFRMLAPADLGGGEVHVATMVRALEELARGDAAVAWCAMTGATTGLLTAYLDPAGGKEIIRDPATVTAGVFAPMGRAIPVEGGFRLTGRWPFASGCDNSNWRMGGALVIDDGEPRQLANGHPAVVSLFFPAEHSQIIDTWSVSGLCGTGSHDIAVEDIFVPTKHAASLFTDPPQHNGALFAFPPFGMLATGIAAVALGIARAAIDELTTLVLKKRGPGGKGTKAGQERVQIAVADAEAEVRAARALVYQTVYAVWQRAEADGAIGMAERADLRLAATHATRCSARAVDAMYEVGGGSSIYQSNPLQRHFRDVHTATQHLMVSRPTFKTVGKVLLGQETRTAEL